MRITHPFHPRSGQVLDLVVIRHLGLDERACLEAPDGQLVWLPRRWTSLEPPDAFVEMSAGRSAFRTQDLIELAEILQRLRAPAAPAGGQPDV